MIRLPFIGRRVPRRAILELDLEREMVEYVPDDPVARWMQREVTPLRDVIDAIVRAAKDGRVIGLLARIGDGPTGLARTEELRDAVKLFRDTGKPAIAVSDSFGEFGPGHAGYYLATTFDEIWLQPSGDVGLTGLSVRTPFLRRTLDAIGVEPRIEHRQEYKTAANTFTEEEFTEPHREALESLVRALFDQLAGSVAKARDLPPETVAELVDRAPFPAREAMEARLVDHVGYRDQAIRALEERVGGAGEPIADDEYLKRAGRPNRKGKKTIAVIHGTGPVQRGTGLFHPTVGPVMAAASIADAFREAVDDDRVRAILFRVDSPGGSYVASDTIRREVVHARRSGTPVVVSMGNVAASGGYFVAMDADRIVAHPSTLTGSIGVVGGKMVTGELWRRLGVRWGEVHVGEHAAMWSTLRDYSPDEKDLVDGWLDRVYDDFTGQVARARGLEPEEIDRAARGRVWTGTDALRLGLVDTLGGYPLALRIACRAAGLEPDGRIRVTTYPKKKSTLELLLSRRSSSRAPAVPRDLASLLRAVAALVAPGGPLRMPPIDSTGR